MSWTPGPFDPDPGALLNIASGILLVGLGVFVGAVKPRRRANLAFAGFSASWGLYTIVEWMFDPGRGVLPAAPGSALLLASYVAFLILLAAAMTFLPLVAIWFPHRLLPRERSLVWKAGLGAGLFGVVALGLWIAAGASTWRLPAVSGDPLLVALALMALDLVNVAGRFTVFLFALFLLVLRAGLAHREDRHPERRQYVLVAVSLTLYAGALNGIWASAMDVRIYPGSVLVPVFVAFCTISGIWLWQTRSGPTEATRTARNVALITLLSPVGAWVLFAFLKAYTGPGQSPGLAGAMRTLTVLILGYAIVRHQLLGIDVKLRWTISKSTVAAVFVAAFFVASEGAQIVFGQRNEWVGLFAAGMLVFAIAPLQRAADHLAVKAVPLSSPGPPSVVVDKEEAYRRALRFALRDQALTREEERDLFLIAGELGLSPVRAFELREEMEGKGVSVAKGVDE